MPNNTTNRLTIEGASVDQFIEDARGQGENKDINDKYVPLDFESLLPTPSEMLGGKNQPTENGGWKAPAWYEWRIENWGTIWNCYDFHGEWQPNSPTNYSLEFYTAWNAPTALFEKVSVDYPDITFALEFADEGCAFLGRDTIKNGAVVERTTYDWCSNEGKDFRKSLGIYFEENEDEEC